MWLWWIVVDHGQPRLTTVNHSSPQSTTVNHSQPHPHKQNCNVCLNASGDAFLQKHCNMCLRGVGHRQNQALPCASDHWGRPSPKTIFGVNLGLHLVLNPKFRGVPGGLSRLNRLDDWIGACVVDFRSFALCTASTLVFQLHHVAAFCALLGPLFLDLRSSRGVAAQITLILPLFESN